MFFKAFPSRLCALGLVLLALSINVRAVDVALKVGDPAPKLFVSKWLNGDPVDNFEKGKIYVLECWATWCGPCVASIPHVSEMNTKLKDKGVVFIGMNVWEQDTAAVEPFVKKMGSQMNYRVAIDEGGRQGKTAQAWLMAAGRNGIPCAFVVDKEGKIAWIGHPMQNMNRVLEQLVAGTYDVKKEAEIEAKREAIEKRMRTAAEAEDFDKMMAIADEMVAMDPSTASGVGVMKFNVLLRGKKDYAGAYAIASKLADNELKNEPQALNEIAWTILDAEGLEKRDLDVALKLATRADELTKHSDAAILDTLARANFDKGNKEKAVELQTLAVSKTEDEEMKKSLSETLARYKDAAGKK